jgi:hypothetical protein
MTTKCIATALALGFLGFTLAMLHVTSAQAGCIERKFLERPVFCLPGEDQGLVGGKKDPATGTYYFFADCCCNAPKRLVSGVCKEVAVLPGSTTGKKGGFIQMKPTCAAGFVWSESANNCVAAPATTKKKKKKQKQKRQEDDDDD